MPKIAISTELHPIEELFEHFDGDSRNYVEQALAMKNVKRRQEFLTIRLLIDSLLPSLPTVQYYPTGAPYLVDDSHYLSISHTHGCVAVAIHPSLSIGIDVESYSSRALKVASRFLSNAELSVMNSMPLLEQERWATTVWSIKESLFKAIEAENVDFSKHLQLPLFKWGTQGVFTIRETRTVAQDMYEVRYKHYSDFVQTTAIKKEP